MTLWSGGLVKSRGKLKLLYFHYRSGNYYIFPTRTPMATELGRMITFLDWLLHILDSLITWLYEITWQTKSIISPIPRCLWLPNLLGWWLTFRESSTSWSPDPLIMWSCLITWQTKNIIFLLLQYIWPRNLACWSYTRKNSHSKSYLIPQSRGFVKLRDMLNTLYLHSH